MSADDVYLFHQTPGELAEVLMTYCDICSGDILCEPFRGEGAFYNMFPAENPKVWAEIQQGIDYTSLTEPVDWVITNPPFRFETTTPGRRVNSFYVALNHFTKLARKGVAFLTNDKCFSCLTPRRIMLLQQDGWFLHKIIVCGVKKWRGRYFFIIFKRQPSSFFSTITHTF